LGVFELESKPDGNGIQRIDKGKELLSIDRRAEDFIDDIFSQ